ncbi:MAG: hypothetical protein MJ078_09140, partial [Clostridia bacterium]|nr:hypothetical protein [Clostridia bacterium]
MDSKHETTPMAWDAVAWLKEWIPIWNSHDKWQQHGFRAKYYKDHVCFVMDRCYVSVSGKRVEIPW